MSNIFILRESIIEPFDKFLTLACRQLGLQTSVTLQTYTGPITLATVNTESDNIGRASFLIIMQTAQERAELLAQNEIGVDQALIDSEIERLIDENSSIYREIRNISSATILWLGLEYSVELALRYADELHRLANNYAINEVNKQTRQLLASDGSAHFIDINNLIYLAGANHFFDRRGWALARMPYQTEGLKVMASYFSRIVLSVSGGTKKCIVLDCDNTLWGGVLGEDGYNNIKLDPTYPGSAYVKFQCWIKHLQRQGFILAICSRNNEEDVFNVIEKHPYMLLRKESFVAWKINYLDKATNIAQLAKELNIGLQSIIFFDDSSHEIELISNLLPEVTAIKVDPKNPAKSTQLLLECASLDKVKITEADGKRTTMYREENSRKEYLTKTKSIEEYYTGLQMTGQFQLATAFTLPRLESLFQRTNQFNLNGIRPNISELTNLVRSDNYRVYQLSLSDKFGDMGIIGAALIEIIQTSWHISNLILSCRALGRDIEKCFLQRILSEAMTNSATQVVGYFKKTPKNASFSDFYTKCGFSLDDKSSLFTLRLDRELNFGKNVFINGMWE